MAPTQTALYRDLAGEGLQLSWSEAELPERERTKHVHRLHPYLGKFIPQLVEALLGRYVRKGGRVLDPFAGSGTTLVQALESGHDAVGVDIAAFNCLLMRVKTSGYDLFLLEKELRDALSRRARTQRRPSRFVREWYAPRAASELLHFRDLADEYEHADVLRVILARAARSARLTSHFDLDFPRAPTREPYWCHKHKRTCTPVDGSRQVHRSLSASTPSSASRRSTTCGTGRARPRSSMATRARSTSAAPSTRSSRRRRIPVSSTTTSSTATRTSYSGSTTAATCELGAAVRGTSRAAVDEYVNGISAVLANVLPALRPRAPVLVVVNDRRDLYPAIFERVGLRIVERLERHVNRRTGRRSGEYYESIFVAVREP